MTDKKPRARYDIAGFPRYEFHVFSSHEARVWDTERGCYSNISTKRHQKQRVWMTDPDGKRQNVSMPRAACLALLGYPPTNEPYRPYLLDGKITRPMWVTYHWFARFEYQNAVKPVQFWAIVEAVNEMQAKQGYVNQSEIARKFCTSHTTVWRILKRINY
jgi:hypothetical protein